MSERDLKVAGEQDVAMPMRDGTILRADITRPADSGRYPVLMQRIPYDKRRMAVSLPPDVAASRGYVVINQDVRGRFASEGDYYPFRDDDRDGYDSVEWAAAQPWSNGKVGLFGGSYMGATQYCAAGALPPHLACLFPSITGSSHYHGWVYHGGAFNLLSRMGWTMTMAADTAQKKKIALPANMQSLLNEMARSMVVRMRGDPEEIAAVTKRLGEMYEPWFRHLPLKTLPMPHEVAPYYFDWLEHSVEGPHWDTLNVAKKHAILPYPAFHLGGWYDLFCLGTLSNFIGLKSNAATEEARKGQRLMVGPWTHGNFTSQAGEMSFGPQANLAAPEMTELQLKWFDCWLKGEASGVMDTPPVRLFVMGRNSWRDENEWPLARTRYVRYYAHSEGRANSLRGDGKLDALAPGEEPSDTFIYDPNDPVPTMGGNFLPIGQIAGVRDQMPVELREDVLVYTSDVLQEDLEVTGPVGVELWAASSAPDTDFTAKLVDVYPNGYAQNIQDGIIRARFRESLREPRLIQPDEALQYRIDLSSSSNVFLAGHRLRLEISSSNFPHYDRNPNTGHAFGEDAELRVARQRVFHDSSRPTCIVLPVIPKP